MAAADHHADRYCVPYPVDQWAKVNRAIHDDDRATDLSDDDITAAIDDIRTADNIAIDPNGIVAVQYGYTFQHYNLST